MRGGIDGWMMGVFCIKKYLKVLVGKVYLKGHFISFSIFTDGVHVGGWRSIPSCWIPPNPFG